MIKKTNPEDLLAQGIHLGHKSAKVHPRAKQYIYKIERGVAIIDLFKTATYLDKAKEFVFDLGKQNKSLLVLTTKNQVKNLVKELCQNQIKNDENGHILYITNKWVGGFLTNFEEVSKNIKKANQLKKEKKEGAWDTFPKHERVKFEKKLRRILSIYQGVEKIEKLPDALFIIDVKRENNAVLEAQQKNIPIVAIADTDANPDPITYPIPANDDAVTSVKYITEQILDAYNKGRKAAEKSKIKG